MKHLVTNQEVVALAFGDGEYLSAEVVSESDIAVAEERYICPIVGKKLYEKLLSGDYTSLREEYVAPALAMAVRVMIQPALNVRTGQCGLSVSASMRSDSSTKSAVDTLQRSLVKRRRALCRRLSNYLNAHASEFPEYDKRGDAMQKCVLDGGYIQIC